MSQKTPGANPEQKESGSIDSNVCHIVLNPFGGIGVTARVQYVSILVTVQMFLALMMLGGI